MLLRLNFRAFLTIYVLKLCRTSCLRGFKVILFLFQRHLYEIQYY